jgi:hypothetical protein
LEINLSKSKKLRQQRSVYFSINSLMCNKLIFSNETQNNGNKTAKDETIEGKRMEVNGKKVLTQLL